MTAIINEESFVSRFSRSTKTSDAEFKDMLNTYFFCSTHVVISLASSKLQPHYSVLPVSRGLPLYLRIWHPVVQCQSVYTDKCLHIYHNETEPNYKDKKNIEKSRRKGRKAKQSSLFIWKYHSAFEYLKRLL